MTGTTPAAPIEITVLQASGCHFCQDAQEVVNALAAEYPIAVRLIEVRSVEGQRLVGVHRPAMNPLVLLDGEFFSAGRLPRGKLRKALDRLVAARAEASAHAEAGGPTGAGEPTGAGGPHGAAGPPAAGGRRVERVG